MSGIAMGFFKNSRVLLAAARSSSSPAAATKKTPAPPRTAAKGPPRSGGITKPVPVSLPSASSSAFPRLLARRLSRRSGSTSNSQPPVTLLLHLMQDCTSRQSNGLRMICDFTVVEDGTKNPTNKREILCDEKLKSVFEGKDKVGFLEIGKLLSHHFIKTV
ncbi:hypothetical protein CK203_056148 [Vitis vinifera]|uniref:SWIB domain-containing protein n=1 Tax=Vitis vinifera TaxID=29760 RepID=A0A438GE96_VITVI|nr:hypothetical protein CK203_056148 [Vitis vinifera]